MNFSYNKGNSLLAVMIFCAVISFMVLNILESSVFQLKMTNDFEQYLKSKSREEAILKQVEMYLENNFILDQHDPAFRKSFPNSLITHIQFVPDTLDLGETQGVDYYKIFTNDFGGSITIATPRFTLDSAKTPNVDMLQLISALPCLSKAHIQQIIMGRHPYQAGALVYVLAYYPSEKIHRLYAFSDPHHHHLSCEDRLYTVREGIIGNITLRQGLLLIATPTTLRIYDAFTGQLRRQVPITPIRNNTALSMSEITAPRVIMQKPREALRQVFVPTETGVGQAMIDVDYDRLGRRTRHHAT